MDTSDTGVGGAESPQGTTEAARWLTGLGAFLLIAAAAAFTAARWDEIPDGAKLAALVAVTGLCLGADRWLRSRLPITATAVFHIGVLLVPVDVAAVGAGQGWAWPTMVLTQGVALTAAGALGARMLGRRSVVLLAATWLGTVLVASGLGAVYGAPAGLTLAALALMIAVLPLPPALSSWFSPAPAGSLDPAVAGPGGSRGLADVAAGGWAALAGLATPLAAAEGLGLPAAGVLRDLHLATDAPHPLAALTGLVTGTALAVVAARHRNVVPAVLALVCVFVGVTTTWVSLAPSPGSSLVAVAVVLVLSELGAWAVRDDRSWSGPADALAQVGEAVGAVVTIGFGGLLLAAPFLPVANPAPALAAAVVGVSWGVAVARRSQPGGAMAHWPWTARSSAGAGARLSAVLLAAAAVPVLMVDDSLLPARAVGLAAVGGLSLLVPLRSVPGAAGARPTAGLLLVGAPVVAYEQPVLAGVLGWGGALLLAATARELSRYSGGRAFNGLVHTQVVLTLAAVAVGWGVVVADGSSTTGVNLHGAPASAGAIVVLWLVARVLDRARVAPVPRPLPVWSLDFTPPEPRALGVVARVSALVPLVMLPAVLAAGPISGTDGLDGVVAVSCLFAGLALVDAGRRQEPALLIGASAGVSLALGAGAVVAGLAVESAGIAVTASGLVWLAGARFVDGPWRTAYLGAAALPAVAGLLVGIEDQAALSANLILIGVGGLAVGLALRELLPLAVGGSAAAFGTWQLLAHHDVVLLEAYVAPAALLWLVLGLHLRQTQTTRVSSWVSYAPPVVLFGGAAFLERLGAGSGWHAVVAGGVGVAAVTVGGVWRLVGPLFTGTTLVVAVTVHESLGATARMPTWGWLFLGGTVLLGAGILLERRGVRPADTRRHLVEVISERFS